MDDDDMYESMPPASTMSTHMLAGAAAGVMEHVVMYPIDCVKTRMQCLLPDPKANYRSVADALYRIIRYEGVRQTVKGINIVMYGAGPAHALYFACYEKIKEVLSRQNQSNHLVHGVAGVGATVMHDAVMTPVDVIKQRMQTYKSPYRTCAECGRTVLRREGVPAFYRSFTTQLAMNVPFQSLHFIVYEACEARLNPRRRYNPSAHVVSGAAAGAIAAAVTSPLDVCKTLLNTQEGCVRRGGGGRGGGGGKAAISGLPHAVRVVYASGGFRAFFRGTSARIIHQMPATAISWSVYEFFKYALSTSAAGRGEGGGAGDDASYIGGVTVAAAAAPVAMATVSNP